MSVVAGTRLGPYEILGFVGAGGMGEVYKARDTRLDRIVAIKVLRADASSDPDRRARFDREARTIAGLTHPHICTLHDVGDYAGSMFLVMEHLEGQTLEDRLEKGPIVLEQALTTATEIADALATAHRQGIVHRDLKPGNVMLTKSGAKLLDFGLAKLRPHDGVRLVPDLSESTTRMKPVTTAGTLVGTLPYMAPEQIEGREADARTDLWAFGCVLYEMVTGRHAFEGTTPGSLVGEILAREPAPMASSRPLTPPALDRLVKRCLAKDPDARWDSSHDIADELRWIQESSGAAPAVTGATTTTRWWRLAAAAGAVLMAVALAAAWWLRPSGAAHQVARLTLDLRPAQELNGGASFPRFAPTSGGSRTALTWTPDGRSLVFVGGRDGVRQIYVRPLDAPGAYALPNTDGAMNPAVSADGNWIAFCANGAIRKVPIGGGPAMELARVDLPWGLAWDTAGNLFFGREGSPIMQVPVGGTTHAVTALREGEVMHSLPWPLPDGRTLLYTVRKRIWSWGDDEVVAQTIGTGQRKVLLRDAADARYVASGHLVFLRRGVLFAVPFDPRRGEITGTEVPVLETVAQGLIGGNNGDVTGAGQFAVSNAGTLAWVPGAIAEHAGRALVVVDRAGRVTALPAPERSYGGLHVSPDGRRIAASIPEVNAVGLWVYDIDRHSLTAISRDGEMMWPIWSPDGRRIVFRWLKDGRLSLASQVTDGSAPPVVLARGFFFPSSFAPDGRRIVAVSGIEDHGIVMVNADGTAGVQSLVETPTEEAWPELSPDGRWLAYVSIHSGRFEVYVRAASGGGAGEQVSYDGGESPAWHPRGGELFFLSLPDANGRRRLMSAQLTEDAPPRAVRRPRLLFEIDDHLRFNCIPVRCYGVSPDGQQFYATEPRWPAPSPRVTHINVVLNWFEELKAKVPAK